MKIYGLLNGFFYIFFGLYGAFMPKHLASETMGWAPNILGLHQIRAIWVGFVGIGIICVLVALRGNRRALTQTIIITTLCFMLGRILGLVLDGTGPQQTYFEIAFEIFWSGTGLFLLSRTKS